MLELMPDEGCAVGPSMGAGGRVVGWAGKLGILMGMGQLEQPSVPESRQNTHPDPDAISFEPRKASKQIA